MDESFDGCLVEMEWLELIWKLVMFNKVIFVILYELFLDFFYVFFCYLLCFWLGLFCKKLVFFCEGYNVSVVDIWDWEEYVCIVEMEGDYNIGVYVY